MRAGYFMQLPQPVDVLLRKAKADEFAVEKLAPDPDCADEIIGFHAQQAVEKLIKAVLAHRSVPFPRIHDLTELVDLLRENKIAFPEQLEETDRLTPFATVFRYAELLTQPLSDFDRSWALDCVRKVRAWAESMLRAPETG